MKQKLVNIIGLIASVFVFLFLLFSLIKSYTRLKKGDALIDRNRIKLEKIKVENQRLEDELKKVQSSDYVEAEIRNKYGLVKAGEAVVVLPDPEIVKKLSPQIPDDIEVKPKSNVLKWWNLFK